MTGILMTKVSTPIIGQVAWLLGKIMDGIYRVLYGVFGIQNLGVCIILLTIIIYTLLIPLTMKQQKFSKLSAAMNPEIQKVQKKYQGKKDQVSMQKMQDETQMVYDKYGISPTGGCLSSIIQLIVLWPMWYVIRSIPAYVTQVKEVYTSLVNGIMATDGWQAVMEAIGKESPVLMDPSKYDYTTKNVLIDVLYKFQSTTWDTLIEKFPSLESVINTTVSQLDKMNNFLGMNIAESPTTLIKSGFSAGTYGIVIGAILIPLLAGGFQYLSVKISSQTTGNTDQNDQMAATMKSMNVMMPLLSVFMCFTMPVGLGLYWVTSALVRIIQTYFINKHMNKIPIEEMIEKNKKKAAKKRKNKKSVESKTVTEMAQKKARNIHEPVRSAAEEKALQDKLDEAKAKNENAKEGSLAAKANMVKRFNETNR